MIQIPAETIVRHASIVQRATDPMFQCLRLESGLIISSDRQLLTVEQVTPSWQGTFHINLTDALIEQCRTESALKGLVTVIPNEMLSFTTVKTSYGWTTPDNMGVWYDVSKGIGRWREVIDMCRTPIDTPGVGRAMVWSAKDIATLAAASPTGTVSFERIINPDARPTVIRDVNVGEWVGCFSPTITDGVFRPVAQLPGWLG